MLLSPPLSARLDRDAPAELPSPVAAMLAQPEGPPAAATFLLAALADSLLLVDPAAPPDGTPTVARSSVDVALAFPALAADDDSATAAHPFIAAGVAAYDEAGDEDEGDVDAAGGGSLVARVAAGDAALMARG